MNKVITWAVVILAVAGVGYYFYTSPTASGSSVSFSVENLPALAQGHYEGWAVFDGEKVSTGTFNAGDEMTFESERNLAEADQIVITIEPEGDTDEVPSGIVILSGDVSEGAASLAYPTDISALAGSYVLATPTNGGDSDELSGIWFLELPTPPSASLTLPELPSGWIYEGWAVNGGTPVSSGRFTSATGTDSFSGYSGEEAAPAFPGEDFLENAPEGVTFPLDLADGASKVVVSIEPDMNGTDPTGDAPFAIKPLVGDVPEDAEDHTSYDLSFSDSTLPSGTATIR